MIVKGDKKVYRIAEKDFHCSMDVTMHYIGGKWKTVVLWYLRSQPKRFSELKRHIPEITEKMLSLQLKALVAHNLVDREVFPEVPPKVVYSLSERGKTLIPLLEELSKWGRKTGETNGELITIEQG